LPPAAPARRREQRLRRWREQQLLAQVDDQESIARRAQEAQQKSLLGQHGTVQQIGAFLAEGVVLAAQRQQIFVERVQRGMLLALAEVELATLEGTAVCWIGQAGGHHRLRDRRELNQELAPALPHQLGQVRVVVGKK